MVESLARQRRSHCNSTEEMVPPDVEHPGSPGYLSVVLDTTMNRETFDQHFEQFCKESVADGRFTPKREEQLPVLNEDSTQGGWCFTYAMHIGWACRVLAETKPLEHVDVSSMIYFAACGSALVSKFTYLDLRPIRLPLPGLECAAGDLMNLPYETGTVKSLSCMHVMEHIGLGRYGDPVDAQGDLKAAKELSRIVAPGGQLLMVLPLNSTPKVIFNAHRFYSYEMALAMFPDFDLREFALIDGHNIKRHAPLGRIRDVPFGGYEDCGCFHFIKR